MLNLLSVGLTAATFQSFAIAAALAVLVRRLGKSAYSSTLLQEVIVKTTEHFHLDYCPAQDHLILGCILAKPFVLVQQAVSLALLLDLDC